MLDLIYTFLILAHGPHAVQSKMGRASKTIAQQLPFFHLFYCKEVQVQSKTFTINDQFITKQAEMSSEK